MKKRKPQGQKPKEFVSRPFTDLKTVRAARPGAPAAPPAPLVEPEETEDVELFLRAVADAKKLHPVQPDVGKSGKAVATPPRARDEEERVVFLQALENLQLDVSFHDAMPGEDEPARPLGGNRLRQLKRGAIRLDLQLDLHGLTRDEALQGLESFISSAQKRGQEAVLIITGKGNRSPGEPVLQGAVTSWLRVKGKAMVAEFAPAPRNLGGSGAFVVFLKEKLKDEGA